MGVVGNFLSGDLPNNPCSHNPGFIYLGFDNNLFSVQIPQNLSHCSKLAYLGLSNNKFDARFIPKKVVNLANLQALELDNSNLKGVIPKGFGNLTYLRNLSLVNNHLTGEIPSEFGKLYNLQYLQIAGNHLHGQIPTGVYNLSMMRIILLKFNSLQGQLPVDVGYRFPNLVGLELAENNFTGVIPDSLSNCSVILQLSINNFVGSIPFSLGHLKKLEILSLARNHLTGKSSSQELDFFTYLSSCESLRLLYVNSNPWDGFLPASIGNLFMIYLLQTPISEGAFQVKLET